MSVAPAALICTSEKGEYFWCPSGTYVPQCLKDNVFRLCVYVVFSEGYFPCVQVASVESSEALMRPESLQVSTSGMARNIFATGEFARQLSALKSFEPQANGVTYAVMAIGNKTADYAHVSPM
uniref:Uncharacterized protein n=1 Tax=Schistocephalus solidus TaxID=70667 RepID=A0A0X3P1L1_SCHSO